MNETEKALLIAGLLKQKLAKEKELEAISKEIRKLLYVNTSIKK